MDSIKRSKKRLRVASLQYFIRPVETFAQFRDQVDALVETAADYDCDLIVFPEYFTVQLREGFNRTNKVLQ
ncbi:MAG: nitrilase-related carbon-nitrogen hydrolase [Chloroflexota bacterium]